MKAKQVNSLNLVLTPEQQKQLEPLLQANGALKAVYTGSAVRDGKLILSYVACNSGPNPD